MQYILGIDIGTGSTKAVALNIDGAVIATAKKHYPINQPQPGRSEQDPELIYTAFVSCISEVAKNLGSPEAISLSCAMHSVIPVNSAGQALGPMLTWADTRAEHIAQSLRTSANGERIYHVSGTPIHPMSPLCKLIWMRENSPLLFNNAYKFVSIKEFIWYKLFGAFEIDYSVASGSGMFDIIQLQWSSEILAIAQIPVIKKLSQPVDTTCLRAGINPEQAALMGLPVGARFMIGATDGCTANLGSMAIAPGTAALTIGTSGAVRVTGSKPIYDFASQTFNYLLTAKTYISGGAVNNGGIAVNWLLSNFLDKTGLTAADYQELFNAVDAVPAGSNGLVFLPYLYGERAPLWDAKASGAYFNIKPIHGQAHFLRAALEGVCFALNHVLQALETNTPVKQLNVSGGFVSSQTWMQLLADITGKKLVMLQLEDASAIGAAYLAMQVLHPGTDFAVPADLKIVEPDALNHSLYTKMFPAFKQLYTDTRDSMQLLNRITN